MIWAVVYLIGFAATPALSLRADVRDLGEIRLKDVGMGIVVGIFWPLVWGVIGHDWIVERWPVLQRDIGDIVIWRKRK
jgi:hypothetical protein